MVLSSATVRLGIAKGSARKIRVGVGFRKGYASAGSRPLRRYTLAALAGARRGALATGGAWAVLPRRRDGHRQCRGLETSIGPDRSRYFGAEASVEQAAKTGASHFRKAGYRLDKLEKAQLSRPAASPNSARR